MEKMMKGSKELDQSSYLFMEALSNIEPDVKRKKENEPDIENDNVEMMNLYQNRIEIQNKQMIEGDLNEPLPLFPQVISFMNYNQAKNALRVSLYVNDFIQSYQDVDEDDPDHIKYPKYHYK